MPPLKRKRWLPYLLLTMTVLFWSGNFVLGRGIRDLIAPISLNFWRWTGALFVLAPFSLPRIIRQWPLVKKYWLYIILMSIPSIAMFNAFIYIALQTATTTNTVLVNAMIPIFIGLIARIVFGVQLSRLQLTGVMISITGLLFTISHGDWRLFLNLSYSKGDLWTLGAGVAWAVYSVMLRLRPLELDALVFLTAIIASGIVFLTPFYLWEYSIKGGFALSRNELAAVVYVCTFPSVLAYIFWNRGVEMVGAYRAGMFMHLMPVFSILMAAVLLDEQLYLYHVIGMALIFSGIALTSKSGG